MFRLLFQQEPNATECHMFITKYELYYPKALRVLIVWCMKTQWFDLIT